MKVVTLIVPRPFGTKKMNKLKDLGGKFITCVYGMAIEDGQILSLLKVNKKRKEIVRALVDEKKGENILDKLDLNLSKKDQSIAFTVDLDYKGDDEMKYQALYVIVDMSEGDKVIQIAQANGANGATVMHGRGAGVLQESIFMHMTIEPEKDIILMLVANEKVEVIKDAIYDEMGLKDPAKGIIFSLPVSDVRGLVEQN